MAERKRTSGTKKQKATNEEYERRVQAVVQIRLEGAQIWDVTEYFRLQGISLSQRQVYYYCDEADAIIRKSVPMEREQVMQEHLAKRKFLYGRAVTSGEIQTALNVLKDEAALYDLYPAKRTEQTLGGSVTLQTIVGVTDGDILGTEATAGEGAPPGRKV